jgi:tellurite resistance protein TehA-like permease
MSLGAVAITTVAGSLLILHAPESPLLAGLRPFVAGLTLFFWAVATWWIPLLLGLTLWRHVRMRHPLRYDAQLWAVVFPLGMYTVATQRLSMALDLSFLASIPVVLVWLAIIAWAVVAFGLATELWRRLKAYARPHPA